MATTRPGWRSIVDLSFCMFIVVACGSVSLLTYSGAFAPAYDAAGSRDRFVNESSRVPAWTADPESRHQDLPSDNDDVDDSDDDDDDDASALADGTIALRADHGPARLLVDAPVAAPTSLRAVGWSLRGPPSLDQDELTCSSARRISDPPFRRSAWTATDSHHQSQNPLPDNRDVDDRDLDDRDDRDDDDDDDGDDESAGALAATSIDLTADHAEGRRVIEPNDEAHPPAGCETHSLRGPPSRLLSDCDSSLGLDTQSTQLFASARHGLHVPPPAIRPPDRMSRARKRITTETRSQL